MLNGSNFNNNQGAMMDTRKMYEERMQRFFKLSSEIRDICFVIFPTSKVASLDDLYDIRMLVEKLEEAKAYADELLRAKNMKFSRSQQQSKSLGEKQ
jgi:hypothetical protein